MKRRKKTDQCLNCGYSLPDEFDFCPKCGQENRDNQLSFRQLIKEFFANYFSFDSRFGRSIKPFFIKPGQLTYEFIIGKRVSYANPIRLYLVISLFHFFILSQFTQSNMATANTKNAKLINDFDDKSSSQADSILRENGLDSLIANRPDTTSSSDEDKFIFTGDQWKALTEMAAEDYTNQEIQDSLKVNELPFFERHLARQIIRLQQSDMNTVNAYLLKNIPILMFFLLPVYALILKVFFRSRLYITHIIHSLHLHSFLFVVLSIFWVLQMIFGDLPALLNAAVFFMLTFYCIKSFQKVYELKFTKALFRLIGSGFLYMILLIFGLFLEILISLMLF